MTPHVATYGQWEMGATMCIKISEIPGLGEEFELLLSH